MQHFQTGTGALIVLQRALDGNGAIPDVDQLDLGMLTRGTCGSHQNIPFPYWNTNPVQMRQTIGHAERIPKTMLAAILPYSV